MLKFIPQTNYNMVIGGGAVNITYAASLELPFYMAALQKCKPKLTESFCDLQDRVQPLTDIPELCFLLPACPNKIFPMEHLEMASVQTENSTYRLICAMSLMLQGFGIGCLWWTACSYNKWIQ